MFIMILTGRVARENWDPLTTLYDKTVSKTPPKGLLKSFLVQSEDDPHSLENRHGLGYQS